MQSDPEAPDLARTRSLIADERYEEAFVTCAEFAGNDVIPAQVWLGWMYLTGRGVHQNVSIAEEWLRKAAEKGSPEGQFYLAYICRWQHRLTEARHWLDEAAGQGDTPSIYEMGNLCLLGEGVPKNREKAFMYFHEAAKRGHLFARRNIARELISGRRGIRNVPVGILEMFKAFWAVIKVDPGAPEVRRH